MATSMFRMSKDRDTTCITVFRDGDEPYHMSYGSSTTLVGEDRRKVRDLVMDCVNLDFGIMTGGRGLDAATAVGEFVRFAKREVVSIGAAKDGGLLIAVE